MKTTFEHIHPDDGSSFRLLYQNVSADIYRWHYHYHPEIEIVSVYQGTGRRHLGNHLSYYNDGDLVLIGSNIPHGGFGYGAVGEHEEVVIQFMSNFLGESFFQNPEMIEIKQLFDRAKQGIMFYGKTKEMVSQQLYEMMGLSYFERLIQLLKVFQLLATSKEYVLLNAFGTRYDFNMKDQNRLSRIYQYVEKKYQEPLDIKEVADICNLTVPAFCNYFKKIMNQTFTDFLNEYRINQACQQLMEGQSVSDVCFAAGFTNVSYFGRVFKNIKGKSPSEFKKIRLMA
jgi:AraC-like DNA-binding protein